MQRLVVVVAAVVLGGVGSAQGAIVAPSDVRTGEDGRTVRSFQLFATDGELRTADGRTLYVWGYSLEPVPGTATLPAPVLEAHEGERVEITLTNLGPSRAGVHPFPHTIHLHGLDVDQANDGVPETSPAVRVGSSFTYAFDATHAGTYWYHCHVDTIEHLTMGMYGALVVHPADGPGRAWTDGPTFDRSFTLLLSEVDPAWSAAIGEDRTPDRTRFDPRYFFINGRSYPDTLEHADTHLVAHLGERVLVRFVNAGYQWRSMHMHGFHFLVVASDGRPLPEPYLKDTLSIGPGERYDVLVELDQLGAYPLHSHVVLDNTNDGAYPGGIHTMITVVPPGTTLDPAAHGHHGAPAIGNPSASRSRPLFGGFPVRTPERHRDGGLHRPEDATAVLEAADVVIDMRDDRFHPELVTVGVGTTVAWINHDGRLHTVVGDAFASGDLPRGAAFAHTFAEPGTYRYACVNHRGMSGVITVR